MTTIFDSFLDQALRSLPQSIPGPTPKPTPPAARSAPAGRYERCISIDIRHAFYNRSGGVCTDIAIEPTPRTIERLALYGHVVRRRSDGIDLFWDSAVKAQANDIFGKLRKRFGVLPPDIWTRLYEPPLLFVLHLANPRFAVFTDMPTDHRIGDPPLRLSSRVNAPGEMGEAALTVDWNSRLDRASIVDARGMEGIGTSAPPEQDELDGLDGSEAPPNPAEQGPAAQERMQVEQRSQALALLDLHFTRDDSAPIEGWDGMPLDLAPRKPRSGWPSDFFRPVRYTIQFAARHTRWRYLVAARSGTLDSACLSVAAADGTDAGFRLEDGPHFLPDGRAAACLTADDPRAILASPEARLSLMGKPLRGRSHLRTLVDLLPGPAADSVTPADIGQPPPAWSDIYVFV